VSHTKNHSIYTVKGRINDQGTILDKSCMQRGRIQLLHSKMAEN